LISLIRIQFHGALDRRTNLGRDIWIDLMRWHHFLSSHSLNALERLTPGEQLVERGP
jgi:hypothetical protein